jgi:ElaB/YqjD/DUF883 family membrane-anchored ribosome-binding protein
MENLESYSDLVNSSFQAIQAENFTTEQIQQQAQEKAEELKSQIQGAAAPFEAETIRETFGAGINFFKTRTIDAIKQKGQDLLQKGKTALSDKASELKGQIEAKVDELKQRGLDNVEELKNTVQGKVDELTTKGEEFVQKGLSKVEALKSQVEDFGDQAESRIQDFQSQVGEQVDAIQDQATQAVEGVQTQVSQGVEALQSQATQAVEGIQSQADALQTQGTELVNQGRSAVDNVVDKSDYSIEDAGATPELDAMTEDQASDFMDIVEGRSSLGTSLTNEQFQQATQAREAAVRRGMIETDPEETAEVAEEPADDIFSTSASDAFMEAKGTGEITPEPEMLEGDTGLDPDVAQQVQILQSQREMADTGEIAEQFGSPEIQAQATQFQDIDPINIGETPTGAPTQPTELIDTEVEAGDEAEKDVGENVAKLTAQVGDDAEVATDVAEGASVLDIDPITIGVGLAITGITMAVENIFDSGHTPLPQQVQFNVSQQLGI